MSNDTPDRPNPNTAELDAARILLTRLGLTAEDLLEARVPRPQVPTFRDYIPIVAAGARPGTRRVYNSYWNRIDKHWGGRRIDEPTPSEIRQLAVAWDCPFDGPTPMERVVEMARRAAADGADRLCLADTIGTVTPTRMAGLVETVGDSCRSVPVGVHLHDTRGVGIATAFAAMQIGVLDLDASIGGLGGCPFAPGASGNIATEELAYLCAECGIDTGLDLEKLRTAAALAQKLVGRPLESGVLRAGGRRTAA